MALAHFLAAVWSTKWLDPLLMNQFWAVFEPKISNMLLHIFGSKCPTVRLDHSRLYVRRSSILQLKIIVVFCILFSSPVSTSLFIKSALRKWRVGCESCWNFTCILSLSLPPFLECNHSPFFLVKRNYWLGWMWIVIYL